MSWDTLTQTGLIASIIMISIMLYLIVRDSPS
jgi:hypothetical protein